MTNKKKDRIQKKNKNDINLSLRSKDERQEEIRTILENTNLFKKLLKYFPHLLMMADHLT